MERKANNAPGEDAAATKTKAPQMRGFVLHSVVGGRGFEPRTSTV